MEQLTYSHRLKLNVTKSEVIWLGTQQQLAKLSQSDLTLSIGESVRQPSTVVRNLGVLTNIYPWKPMLVIVPRHVSFTCDGSVSCVAMSTTTHCIYADTCTDIVTFGLLQQFVRLQLTDYTSPSAACARCCCQALLWCFSPDACTTSLFTCFQILHKIWKLCMKLGQLLENL